MITFSDILRILFAAVILMSVAAFFRMKGLTVSTFLAVSPFILAHQFLFNSVYANRNSSFIVAWFIATATTSILSYLMSIFLFSEHIDVFKITGILLILAGAVMLKI